MLRHHRKILACLAVLFTAIFLSAAASAEGSVTAGGTIGDLSWTMYSDGLLTVSGTGPMESFEYGYAPWSEYAVTSARIESGVTTVADYAFFEQSGLKSVSLPDTLTEIGRDAFYECGELTSVTVPSRVSRIGEQAFCYCSKLESLSLPNNISWIGNSAFFGCPTGFSPPIGSATAKALGRAGYEFTASSGKFVLCYTFENDRCTGLCLYRVTGKRKTLTVPDGVTVIADDALEKSAPVLKRITLPDSVKSLSTYLFSGTPRNFYIKCGKGSYAERFARENGLQYDNGKKKVVGYSITDVNQKVRWVVSNYITSGMTERQKVKVLHDWLVHNAHYDLTYSTYHASGVLLSGKGVCQSYAEAMEKLLTQAGIANKFMSGSANNGSGAGFQGHAWNMVRVDGQWYHLDATWDDPVWSIEKVSKDNAPVISGMERYDYFLLTDKKIRKDHRWSASVSADKNQVGSFHHNATEYAYTAAGAFKLNRSKRTAVFVFPANKYATKLTIPSAVAYNGVSYRVTEIGANAGKGMKKLKTLIISASVGKIGKGAFQNCGKLRTVTLGAGVKSIGTNAFSGCGSLKYVRYGGSKNKREKIKVYSGNAALMNASWKYKVKSAAKASTVVAPDGDPVPEGEPEQTPDTDQSTVKITVSGAVYKLYTDNRTAVLMEYENKKAEKVVLPDRVPYEGVRYMVVKIGPDAFKGMTKLKSVTVGKYVNTISHGAFSGCRRLEKVTLTTNRLVSVGRDAFLGVSKQIRIRCSEKKLSAYTALLKDRLPETAVVKKISSGR